MSPWEEYPDLWASKSSFFAWLRGGLRRAIWEKYPPKLEFKNSAAYTPPPTYKGKAKRLGKCALSGDEQPISKMEVDHIQGHVSLKDWEDVLPFIQHLCASKQNMQLVSKEAHKIKSYAEKMGISFEEALIEKQAIQIVKEKKDKQWLQTRGITPAGNAKARREQIVNKLKGETSG